GERASPGRVIGGGGVRSGSARGGRRQAEGAGLLDGLVPAVHAELVVEVAHVGLDRVDRQVQLTRDLRGGELGGQVAQHPRLGVAERFAQVLRPGRRRARFLRGQERYVVRDP